MEYYSAIEKNEIMPFAATWMQLQIIILNEVKSERERQIYDITYTWNLEYDTNEPIYETETDRHREQTCGCQGGGSWGRDGMGGWG